ncbi:MAG: galactose-1-phosphate uridylyltransferase [Firmicutes bacterium]|nr:galactose-1-phosphate uridylyltransferase [Bacillota bacterium]MCL5038245.1 galactose-1-phosphate uridylyltransferase [Bacillota bacterium]
MPELRENPVTQSWVVIATERAKRPTDFVHPAAPRKGTANCPFCYGNEDKTPPEILAYRPQDTRPDTPGWRVRVVPNKFPALSDEGDLVATREGFFRGMTGYGVHEVVVESPEHDLTLPYQTPEQVYNVLSALKERFANLSRDRRLRYVQIFKNHGGVAGASLEHPHFQIIATPLIPAETETELKNAYDYYHEHGECLFCRMMGAELGEARRILRADDSFVTFNPYGSRFPFETWILPRHHNSSFGSISEKEVRDLALAVQDALGRLDEVLTDPPYNLILHTAPLDLEAREYYHWHIEVLPRLTIVAGFEWGTGFFINPTPPEDAARFLQEVKNPEE